MRRTSWAIATAVVAFNAVILTLSPAWAQRAPRFERETVNGRDAVAREVLVKFRTPLVTPELVDLVAQTDAQAVERVGKAGTLRLRSRSQSAAALIRELSRRGDVLYAEPNHIVQIVTTPNDSRFGELWGIQTVSAPAAWDLTTGANSNVVIGVIDTGIDYTHPDLAPNIWSAPEAFTVSLSSGVVHCAAGTHGFNAITRQCDPMDDHDHGTHVSGTIGAVGNNGVGVVGVNWNAHMIGLKFLDEQGSGTIADAIAAIEFAAAVKQAFQSTDGANIRVLSNSWGGTEGSQALLDEINAANDADMLFVVAAGNNGTNNDFFPFFPAAYSAPNVVTVAATSFGDTLTFFSNYGATSVHLGAPGDAILSTTIGNTYSSFSGTSMASPHVSGAAALVLSLCTLDTATLKDTLLGSVDYLPGLTAKTITGGRLNVNSALHACTAPPETPSGLTALGRNAQVILSWPGVPGAMRYDIKRSLTAGGPYTVLAPDVKATTYIDTAVVNDTTYYYVVSAENTLGESGDSNEASATPKVPSDLVISTFTAPSVGGAGSSIAISVTTANTGLAIAPSSVTRIYLSTDLSVDGADTVLTEVAVPELAPGANAPASLSVSIPATAVVDKYYLIASADGDGQLYESSESNNESSRWIRIGPDLTISSVSVPASTSPGTAIPVTEGTRNSGGATATSTATALYLSVNSSFSGDDVLLGSRAVPAVAAGATDTATTTVTIPAATAVGTYYIVAVADISDALLETTETNNTSYRQILIGGDLIVSSLVVPSTAGPGSTIVVTDTTKNAGSGSVSASITRFYVSMNSTFDATDTPLPDSHAVPALDAGASHASSTTVTLPMSLATGSYYIVARADSDGIVSETTESNNTLGRAIAIGGDLVVAALTAPATASPGAEISVTDTTENRGAGAATASVTRFYLSANSTLDPADTLLSGGRAVPDLPGGSDSSATVSVTLPSSVGAGSYYLIANADNDKVVSETSETNNTLSRLIKIGGDLAVSSLTVPVKSGAGMSVMVNETTTNQGSSSVGPTVTKFYLSANASYDATDTLIGSRDVPALAGGAASSVATALVVPTNVAAASYWVIARADADAGVAETNETNNTLGQGIAIGGDLVIGVPTGSLKGAASLSLDFTDTVTNQGGGPSAASTTRYYLSTNTTLSADDVLLGGGRDVAGLTPGGVSTGSTTIWLPASASPGVFYIVAKADGDNLVGETSESNNTASRQIAIGPDLVVSSFSAPASGVVGSSINITETVRNQGAADVASTSARFYLSTNSTLDAADTPLGSGRSVPSLAGGASSSGTTPVTIPATTNPGFYYLLVKADGDSAAAESSEVNNVSVRTMWVTAP